MKVNSPQLGFNNNVRHKGRALHIQTEDSGVKHPHVITHLFADGGRILKSTKTSYAEFLEEDELPKKVRALMQEQHKAMFIALRAGKFDHMLGDTPGDVAPVKDEIATRPPQPSLVNATDFVRDPTALADTMPSGGPAAVLPPTPAPPAVAAPAAPPPPAAAADAATRSPSSRPRATTAAAAPIALRAQAEREPESEPGAPISAKARLTPPPARHSQPPPPPPSQPANRPKTQPPPPPAFRNMMGRPSSPDILARGIPPARPPEAAAAAPKKAPPPAPPSAPMRPNDQRPGLPPRGNLHRPPLPAGIDLDLQALELAAEQTNAPVYQQVRDLPPPPAAVFKGSLPESTAYRVTGSNKPAPPPPRRPVVEDARKLTPGASRYAPSRPASIFGNAKPQEGSSIFGEDLISEKSLDEVILSYLAEDLEGGAKK